MQVALLLLK